MRTIDQSSQYPRIEIGSVFKTKVDHYLEEYEDLGKVTYDNAFLLHAGEIVTYTKIEEHPYWDDCFAIQVLYDCKLWWISIHKNHFTNVMTKEFELVV